MVLVYVRDTIAGAVEYYTDIKTLYYGKIPSHIWQSNSSWCVWYDLCSVHSLDA